MRYPRLAPTLLLCAFWAAPCLGAGQGQLPAEEPAAGARAEAPASRRNWLGRVPGIYPVYDFGGRWVLLERAAGSARRLRKGSEVVVIGSSGADRFYAAASTRTWVAACQGHKPAPTGGFLLSSGSAGSFKKVGTPIVAILLRKGAAYDTSRAGFHVLANEVVEATYGRYDTIVRGEALSDIRSGDFAVDPADHEGLRAAQLSDTERVQTKFDYGTRIKHAAFKGAFLLVEGSQVSKAYRRCLHLFDDDRPVGRCSEMPHALMAETRTLRFVSYDPGTGRPFILAYSEKEPLWGHERWGFQMTEQGPRVFLMDALDPNCREGF